MNQKKIFIASVLKAVDDVRNYDKLADSLAKANKYEIFILGKGRDKKSGNNKIYFRTTGHFQRLSFRRLLIQFIFFLEVIRIKPDVLLITTIELLPIATFCKVLLRCRLVFDVQENHYSNFKNQPEYHKVSGAILSLTVLAFEKMFYPFVDHFILAESIYKSETHGLKDRFSILENKAIVDVQKGRNSSWEYGYHLNIIFTGTLSEYSGIETSIQLFEKINQKYPNSTFTIVGVYHQARIKKLLNEACRTSRSIKLFIDSNPVEHHKIEDQILKADLGIIGYTPNPTNQNRTPTKLFEYASYGLPYLIYDHPHWKTITEKIGGGIVMDFVDLDVEGLLKALDNIKKWDREKGQWREETQTLIDLFETLLQDS
ncbi:MAG: hypothetical protein JXR03_13540 [Cyclobacteriaceae bacterium]